MNSATANPTGFQVRRLNWFWSLWGILLGVCMLAQVMGRLVTPPGYSNFADTLGLCGVPNIKNVLSNLPFIMTGIYYGIKMHKNREPDFLLIVYGAILIGFGSSWYHLLPNDHRLVWDRLPISVVFAGIFTHVLLKLELLPAYFQSRVQLFTGIYAIFCAFSVLLWYVGTMFNENWLGLYVFVQFGQMLLLLYLMVSALKRNESHLFYSLLLVSFIYTLAKICEHYDLWIYTHFFFSGHTIKHFLSSLAIIIFLQRQYKMKNQ